jgi:CRP/FNR family cyclic AMP-dependent transcriptional regulator
VSPCGSLHVLDHDAGLAEAVHSGRRAAARAASHVTVVRVPRGAWDANEEAERCRGGHGLLVLDGLLIRRVAIDQHYGAELLGPGDPISPLEYAGAASSVAIESAWNVIEPLELAVLDRFWSFRMAAHPEVAIELASRGVRRSRRLANTLAISQQRRLELRLDLLLWELADRYGRPTVDGMSLDLPISHELLAQLAVARRPSVTTALARLRRDGRVERHHGGWLLHGEAPTLDEPAASRAQSP